jgi:small subunit ribosomal protein S18
MIMSKMQNNKRKDCHFRKNKFVYIDYKDIVLLKRFLTDNGKILPRRITGVSAYWQRQLCTAVNRARNSGLLAYTYTQVDMPNPRRNFSRGDRTERAERPERPIPA